MKRTGWITGVLAAVLVMAGCSVPGAGAPEAPVDPLTAFYTQQIDWEECDGAFECGVYEVPMDYTDPDGRRLEIAVKRLPASGAGQIGSLVVNPGGPGGSGVDYVGAAHTIVSDQVRERFDIVGFDPRGVGRSSPVRCLDTAGLDDYIGLELDSRDGDGDPTKVTEAGLNELERVNRAFVQACQDQSGELLAHVGTANVARDMDVLRAVLGDDALTYLGKSYGTLIGTYYAELFPQNVRALVLDGAVDPDGDQLEVSVEQAEGFTTALDAFVEDCLTRPDCPLSDGPDTTVEQGIDRIAELLEQAAREPLANQLDDGREINRGRVELGVLAALYSESFWPQVRSGLTDAIVHGDGSALLQLGDLLYGRDDPEKYENSVAVLVAVNCADRTSPRDIAAYQEAAIAAGEVSPVFGPSLAWGALACAYWPEDAVVEPIELDGDGAPPILVVGTTRDSATPYQWSQNLAAVLESGVLLTWDGDGHTAYRSGDSCVDRAVDAYLLESTVPDEGMVCAL